MKKEDLNQKPKEELLQHFLMDILVTILKKTLQLN